MAELRYYGEHMTFQGYRAVYVESEDDEAAAPETAMPDLKEGDAATITGWKTCAALYPAARALHRGVAGQDAGRKGHRPSEHLRADHHHHPGRGYVTREKKRLYPTELGKMVTSMMLEYFAPIVDTEFTASLEDKLDSVEEGKVEWRSILEDFYPPFEKMLEVAEDKIEKVEVQDEVSDVKCDKCGAMMVYKMGRFGRFLACPNFPACRNAKPIVTYIEAPCPKCGARLMEKTSRKNRKFYGCERYPECDFVSWEMPVTEKCPHCGSYMVEKRNKKGERVHLCANEKCRYKVTVKNKEEQDE